MKIIEPAVEIINEENPLKKIELCGRICYKSENMISENSSKKFIEMILKRGHTSVLEHVQFGLVDFLGSIHEIIQINSYFENKLGQFAQPKRGFSIKNSESTLYGNIRTWLEILASNEISNPTKSIIINSIVESESLYEPFFFEFLNLKNDTYCALPLKVNKDYLTVRFICDRGVSHELVRHRVASFSQESTRYCNYSGEVVFIKPCFDWAKNIPVNQNSFNINENLITDKIDYWLGSCVNSEASYNGLIDNGCSPQEARSVLPNSLKTEIIMTATYKEWEGILALRLSKAAHPQMQQIMRLLVNNKDFPKKLNLIYKNY